MIYLEIHQSLVEYENEEIFLCTVHNVTSCKSEEQARLNQEKLKGVLEMAGAACHELNQPLQVVGGNAELLLMDIDESHPLYDGLNERH